MSSAPVVCFDEVTVRYRRRAALDRASFAVARGEVLALLGRNGAGKTTAIRCLLGLERPASGRVTLLGGDPWTRRAELLRRVGYVPEEPQLPPELDARAIGRLAAALTPGFDDVGYRERLRRAEIPAQVRFASLSRGQKAHVALAVALAPRPELLVLDEPSLGLDAIARRALYGEVIGELAERGVTVLISTHDLDAVERVASHVALLALGKVTLSGELETLKLGGAASLDEIFAREAA